MSTVVLRYLRTHTVREEISQGNLPELEFGLLKKHGKKLRWHNHDKAQLLDMAIDFLEARQAHLTYEVHVRSLCHSRGVTADYLKFSERFNMKHTILVVGDVGEAPAPWAELVQAAVYLFQQECNVVWVEVPAFATNSSRWLQHGPEVIDRVLEFFNIREVSALACGVGGTVFLSALVANPDLFGKTHFIYNVDMPSGSRGFSFDLHALENLLRTRELQLWFAYFDKPPEYDREADGTANKAYEHLSKLQARLQGERRRGRRVLHYDEIIFSEKINLPKVEHIKEVQMERNTLLVFSDALLESAARFYQNPPAIFQDDMEAGLVGDVGSRSRTKEALANLAVDSGKMELPALAAYRMQPQPGQRRDTAAANLKRLERMQTAVLALRSPSNPGTPMLQDSRGQTRRRSLGSSGGSMKDVMTLYPHELETALAKSDLQGTHQPRRDTKNSADDYKRDWEMMRAVVAAGSIVGN